MPLIIDDSFYSCTRSKAVELLSWVRDHADGNRNKKGFRMLTLGWTDGNTLLPVSFNLLSSSDPKTRINSATASIDKRTVGFQRCKDALNTAPELALAMLQQALNVGIKAKYVLFDSWYAFPATILKVANLELQTIMLKNHDGERKPLRQIYGSVKQRRGKAKYLASVLIDLQYKEGNFIPAKVVFVRDRHNKIKWLALISTDIDLPETEVIRIYGKRRDIEVFFKMCKSYRRLAKEFQGRSYDIMVAQQPLFFQGTLC